MITSETTDHRYHRYDDGSAEVEVLKFLQSFVELTKPNVVIETGTYVGYSALYIAKGLKENGQGHLITLEIEPKHIEKAKEKWIQGEVKEYITSIIQSSLEYTPSQTVDLLFLDSEPGVRWLELVRFYPYLKEGGFVFIHDLPRGFCKGNINPDHPTFIDWPWGPVPKEVNQWLKEGKLVKWHFDTPREMTGFYKPRKEDYVTD